MTKDLTITVEYDGNKHSYRREMAEDAPNEWIAHMAEKMTRRLLKAFVELL